MRSISLPKEPRRKKGWERLSRWHGSRRRISTSRTSVTRASISAGTGRPSRSVKTTPPRGPHGNVARCRRRNTGSHPRRAALYGCDGWRASRSFPPRWLPFPYRAGDRFLICSDGLIDGLWERKIGIGLANGGEVVKACLRRIAGKGRGKLRIGRYDPHRHRRGVTAVSPARIPHGWHTFCFKCLAGEVGGWFSVSAHGQANR